MPFPFGTYRLPVPAYVPLLVRTAYRTAPRDYQKTLTKNKSRPLGQFLKMAIASAVTATGVARCACAAPPSHATLLPPGARSQAGCCAAFVHAQLTGGRSHPFRRIFAGQQHCHQERASPGLSHNILVGPLRSVLGPKLGAFVALPASVTTTGAQRLSWVH